MLRKEVFCKGMFLVHMVQGRAVVGCYEHVSECLDSIIDGGLIE
jgi:hypothetical protein